MKKIHVIVHQKDIVGAVSRLGDLGTIHVENLENPQGEPLDALKEDANVLFSALAVLKERGTAQEQVPCGDWRRTASEILEKQKNIQKLQELTHKRESEISQLLPWGNFVPGDIKDLEKRGTFVYLCEIVKTDFKNIPDDCIVEVISQEGSVLRAVILSPTKREIAFKQFLLPAISLSGLQTLQEQDKAKLKNTQESLEKFCQFRDSVQEQLDLKLDQKKLSEVALGMKNDGPVSVLKGFVPAKKISELEALARKESWGVLIEDPSDDDFPPTLLENPFWIGLIKPLFSLMNIMPGYRELDVSLFFLLFLSIFFGMLIGDAGYGLVFIALAFYFQKKAGDKLPEATRMIFLLVYVLSSFAVVWGLLTGVFFGQALFGKIFKPLVPWLADNSHVEIFCFVLGSVHLTIAHVWKMLNKIKSIGALAEIGWILIIWASYFFASMLIVGAPLPKFINVMIIAGPALVILFNQPRKNILLGAGLGLGDFLLSVMGFFGDVISYIRLFAVGIAGLAVADTFNQMALSVGFKSIATGLGALFILVFGHVLNMVLALFAILVHGVRLNILEFSSHLGMEWTGVEYSPLQKKLL